MKQVQPICMWLDHPKFGCGYREFIAIIGRKWVTLVQIATADHAQLSKEQFRAMRGKPMAASPKIAKRLRRNAKTYGREDAAAVKEALRLLRPPGASATAGDPVPAAISARRSARTVPEPSARLC